MWLSAFFLCSAGLVGCSEIFTVGVVNACDVDLEVAGQGRDRIRNTAWMTVPAQQARVPLDNASDSIVLRLSPTSPTTAVEIPYGDLATPRKVTGVRYADREFVITPEMCAGLQPR